MFRHDIGFVYNVCDTNLVNTFTQLTLTAQTNTFLVIRRIVGWMKIYARIPVHLMHQYFACSEIVIAIEMNGSRLITQ